MVSRDEIFTCLGGILFRVLGFQACIDVVKDKLKGVYTFAETLNLANACCEGLLRNHCFETAHPLVNTTRS